MFKKDDGVRDNSRDYSKTKREVIEERQKQNANKKLLNDLKPMYDLIAKINHRLEILEEKFYIKYITDTYITIEGNVISGVKSELLAYLLDNLCKVGCSNMGMEKMNKLSMMKIYYNDEAYKIPSISQIEVEKIVHRINELIAQTDCEVFDIDYYEKTVHKKIETYTKADVRKEKRGINRDSNARLWIAAGIIGVLIIMFLNICG